MGRGNKMHNRYTVYNNDTDELIILDGTAEQCAELMGIRRQSFYSLINLFRKGKLKKWHIEASLNEETGANNGR